jgi:hypothetical protein
MYSNNKYTYSRKQNKTRYIQKVLLCHKKKQRFILVMQITYFCLS